MSKIFRALAHPKRREILTLLRRKDCLAGELASELSMANATLSGHLAKLREAGLVDVEAKATQRIYRLNVSVLEEALLTFLNHFSPDEDPEKETTP